MRILGAENWDALLAGKRNHGNPGRQPCDCGDRCRRTDDRLSVTPDGRWSKALVKILTAEGYVQKENTGGSFAHLPKRRPVTGKTVTSWFYRYLSCGRYGREWQEETYEPFWFRTHRFIGLEIQTGKEPKITGFDYLKPVIRWR